MVYINQGELSQAAFVASRNKQLGGNVTYLFSIMHKLSGQRWRFIPYRIPPSVDYTPSYDLFCINVDFNIPENYIGSICGDCNIHLIPGEYYLKIYEQLSPTNLDPQFSYDVVNETLVNVVGENKNIPTSYSGTSDVFIVYNENND